MVNKLQGLWVGLSIVKFLGFAVLGVDFEAFGGGLLTFV